MNKLRAVIVGTGWPSIQHIQGYKKLKNVELTAICGIDQQHCMSVGSEYNIPKIYGDFEYMLDQEKPDIVSICTPNYLHSEMSIFAMERGVNVLCEKPMAISVPQARAMIDMQKKCGKILMIAHQRRFSSQAQYLKKIISDGMLGDIYHVRAHWVRDQGIPGMGGWFTNKKMSGGGALIDIGVHIIDLALWFLDHPEPVGIESSCGSRFGGRGKGASGYAAVHGMGKVFDVDDYVFAHVNYSGGVSLQIQCSWAGFIKQEEVNIELWGEKGGARLYPLEIYTEINNTRVEITPKLNDCNPFDEEVRLFVEAVENGLPSPYDPVEGLRVVELINQIYLKSNSKENDKENGKELKNEEILIV